jgi:hypothetical protein
MDVGMRKAAAIFIILLWGLCQSAFSEGTVGHGGHLEFALAYPLERAAFSFGHDAEKVLPINEAALDRQAFGEAAAARIFPEITASIVKKDAAGSVSLSIFLGRSNGDIFSSLHEQYAWRTKFKTTNLGAGISRDIRLSRTIRVRPYVGVIRSHAILRPSDLYGGNGESFERRLTALCIGLPLVCGFN